MGDLANIHEEFRFIKAAFESGKVKKMSDLEKEKPTLIAKLLGMNQGRYGAKLFTPQDFSLSEVSRLSLVLDVDAGLIMNVINKELVQQEKQRVLSNYIKLKK